MGGMTNGRGSRGSRGAVANVLNTGKRKAIAAVAMLAVVAGIAGGTMLAGADSYPTVHTDASIDSFYTSGLHLDSHAGPELYQAKTGKNFSVTVKTEDTRGAESFEETIFGLDVATQTGLDDDKDYWRAGDKGRRNQWMENDASCGSIWFQDFEAARNATIEVDYPYIGDYNEREVGAKITITNIVPYLRRAAAKLQSDYDWLVTDGEGPSYDEDVYNRHLMQPAIQIADQMKRGIYYENIHSMDIQVEFYYVDNEDNEEAGLVGERLQKENGDVNDIYLTMSSLSLWKDGPMFVSEKVKPLAPVKASYVLNDENNATHIYKKLSEADEGMYSTSYDQYYPLEPGQDVENAEDRLSKYWKAVGGGINYEEDEGNAGWYSPWRMWASYDENGAVKETWDETSYVDTVGHHTFPRQAASMLFEDGNNVKFAVSSTGNTMWFTIYPAGLTNMSPRSPILTDNSKPHKAIFSDDGQAHYPDKAGFGAGADVKYVVEQEVNTLNANSIVRYDSLILEDKVPDAVEISDYYITRATVSIDPDTHEEVISDEEVIATKDDLRGVGEFSRLTYGNATWVEATDSQRAHWSNAATQDDNGNVVRFIFSDDYLQNHMLMEGEHYFLHVDGKVKEDATVGTDLFNVGAVYINNANYDTTKSDNYHPTNVIEEEVVSEQSHQEITLANRTDTFTYAISQLVPEDADRLYVLDTLEDVFEVVGTPRLVYLEGEGDNRELRNVEGAIISVTPANVNAHDGVSQKVEATLEDVVSDGGRTVIPRVTGVHGKSLTLMFDVKLRDGLTDEDLLAYSQGKQVSTYSTTISQDYDDEVSTGKIPNIAKVNFTHDPNGGSDTNVVDVVPPFEPEKAIVKASNSDGLNLNAVGDENDGVYLGAGKGVHLDTAKPGETWTYYISEAVPAGVQTITLTDKLNSHLQLANENDAVRIYLDGGAELTDTKQWDKTANNSLELAVDGAQYAGHTLTFAFDVKFEPREKQEDFDAVVKDYKGIGEASGYNHIGIANRATVSFDGNSKDTNEVTVTATANKGVGSVNANTDQATPRRGSITETHKIEGRDVPYQYGVEYFVSHNATSVVMTDTLEPVLEMATPNAEHVRVFARGVTGQGTENPQFEAWERLAETDYSVSVTDTQDGKRQIVHVSIAPSSLDKVKDKQVRFEFDTRIRATATPEELDSYLAKDDKVPNTATLFVNGNPRVTNTVDVTPPPEKDVYALNGNGEIDNTRGNDDNTHLDLLKRGEVYRYTITERFDGDVKDVSITDILEHVLEFAGEGDSFGNLSIVAVSAAEDGALREDLLAKGADYELTPATGKDSKDADSSGFKVSFKNTGANGTSVVAGKRVTVSFDVRVRSDADLSGYAYNQVPNDATIKVGSNREIKTNKVTVTPPPKKKVYTIDGDAVDVRTGDTDEHAHTLYQTEQVVYRVSDVVPENATKFEMVDTLNYLMELGEGNNGGLEVYWLDGNTKKPVQWSVSYSYPEVDFGTAGNQQTTRIHVNVTDPNLTKPAGETGSLAGKELFFEFKARLKAGLTDNDLAPYMNGEGQERKADVPNTAEVDLGSGPRVTNEVLVTPPGRQDLLIQKDVTRSVAGETFEFRVKFFDVRDNEMTGPGYIFDYDVVPTDKAGGYAASDVLASGRVGSGDTLKLKAGQTAVVKDVYVYVRYTVEELENSYYQQQSVTVDSDNVDGASAGEGRIAADGPNTVTFMNEPKPGELRVKKVVPNVPENATPRFSLDVYLKTSGGPVIGDVPYLIRNDDGTVVDADSRDVIRNEDGSYRSTHKATFESVTFENEGTAKNVQNATSYGRATFEVGPNQTIVFPDLSAGMEYQVWEQDVSGDWINVSRENNVDTIKAGINNAAVVITNEDVAVPNKTVNGRTEVLLDQRVKSFEYKVSYRIPSNPFDKEYLGLSDDEEAPDTLTFTFEDKLEECLELVGAYNGEDIVWPSMPDGASYAVLSYENDEGHTTTLGETSVSEDGGVVSASFEVNEEDGNLVYGKTVTLTFHAKIKDSYTDEQLLEKYGNTTVPNEGTIEVKNDATVYKKPTTNTVHVTPPPTKAIDTGDTDTNDAKTNAILSARDKLFTYSISQTVPANANTIRFQDTLKDVLGAARKDDSGTVYTFDEEYAALTEEQKNGAEFYKLMQKYVTVTATDIEDGNKNEYYVVPMELVPNGASGYIGVENKEGSAFSISVHGQELNLYVSGENAEALRGKHVTVSFGAKIRSEATEHQLQTYVNNEIPNNAIVTINGQPMVTNDVVVVPPPFKEITTGDTDTNEAKTHANLSEAGKVFTYEVKDKVPTMATRVVMYDTLDDLLEFYPGTGRARDYANVKVELHNNALEGTELGGEDYTVSFGTIDSNGNFKEEEGGKTIRIKLTEQGIEKAKANASESTGAVINNGSEIDFVFQAKVRPLDKMTPEQLAKLHEYEASKGGIPNKGTVDFGRGPRVTNEVTVVPPPEKKIEVTTTADEGDGETASTTSLVDFLTLQARDQVHTYRVMDSIPENAVGVVFDDDLESALELVMKDDDDLKGVKVYAFEYSESKTEPDEDDLLTIDSFVSDKNSINDGDIHLEFKDEGEGDAAKSVVAGKTVVVKFDAKIRESTTTGELERYVVRDGGVPNDATFSIGNTHRTTNTVVVVPPPRKLVDGELSRVLQNADQDFTYTVTDVIRTDGHDVVMTDVLEELLELSEVDGVADGGLSVDMSSAGFAKGEVKIDGVQKSVGAANADFTVEIDHGTVDDEGNFSRDANGDRVRVKVTMADTGEGDDKRSVAAGHAITFSFKARIKGTDGMTDQQRRDFDEKLRDYITQESGVPNTATVQVNGHDPRVTNKVTVVPQPEKKVTKQGGSELREHENLDTKTQPFTYTIIHTVGADAKDVTFTDEFDPVLELLKFDADETSTSVSDVVNVRVERGSVSAPEIDTAESSITTVNGKQKLTVAFTKEDGTSTAAGKTVILEFRARIKADADLHPYLENVIENTGKYAIDSTDQWTNTVTVTPAPEKKVNLGVEDATLEKYDYTHYHLKHEGEAFTYSVSDRLPSNATGVVMEDTLEHVLELARTRNGNVVTFADEAEGLSAEQKAELLKDYVTVLQDGHPIAKSHYSVELNSVQKDGKDTTMVCVTVSDDRVSPSDPSQSISRLAGHVAIFQFQAVIKDGEDATPYLTRNEGESGEGVPNKATVRIAGTPRVTNEVSVVPTPVKKVTRDGQTALVDHENLEAMSQQFTYTVTDAFSDHATKVVMTDTLEPVLELVKSGDKYDVKVTSTGENGTVNTLTYDASSTDAYGEGSTGNSFRVKASEADGKQTITVYVTDDATRNAKVSFAFKARIKDGMDDELEPYRQAGNVIPNTATVSINGDPRVSNKVTVTPSPEKLVQGEMHYDVSSANEPFTFTVTDYLPENAKDVWMTDELKPEFSFYPGEGGGNISKANVKVFANGRQVSVNDFDVELDGQKITVHVKERADGSNLSRVAGQRVTFSFDATIDPDADIAQYADKDGVPNDAMVSVQADGQPKVDRTTNEVTVTPPPVELTPVKIITRTDGTGGTEHLDLSAADEVFTYTVTQKVPQDAASLVFSDILNDYLMFDGAVSVTATDADGQNPVALSEYAVSGKALTFTLNSADLAKARGHVLVVKFDAKYDPATVSQAKLSYVDVSASGQTLTGTYREEAVAHTGTPNQATVTVDGTPQHTAVVTVAPPADVPGTLVVKAEKTFEGRDVALSDVFAFDLYYGAVADDGDADGAGGGNVVATAYLHGEDFDEHGAAEVAFPAIVFDAAGVSLNGKTLAADAIGEHAFTVKERDLGVKGVTYDTAARTVNATVTKSDKSVYQLAVSSSAGAGAGVTTDAANNATTANVATFVNTYKPDYTAARVNLELTKELSGADISEYPGAFTFELKGVDGTILEGGPYTATNDAFGNVVFAKPLKYEYDEDKDEEYPLSYTYEVAEKAGSDGHVTYATSPITVTVVVDKDVRANQLVASVSSAVAEDAQGVAASNGEVITRGNELVGEAAANVGTVTNTWTEPDPVTANVTAKKAYKNAKDGAKADLKAGEFEFELVDPDGKVVTWDTGSGEVVDFAANTAEGDVLFPVPALTFTYDDVKDAPGKTKAFHYSIREKHEVFGADDEVAYADERPFTVTVSDNPQTGKLDVTTSDPARFAFINWRLEPGSTKIALRAAKTLKDSRMGQDVAFDANEFQFKVSGGLVAEDGSVSQLAGMPRYAYNQANGSIVFDELPLTQAGTYEFTVEEDVAEDERDANIVYDTAKHTVVVVVEEVDGAPEADAGEPDAESGDADAADAESGDADAAGEDSAAADEGAGSREQDAVDEGESIEPTPNAAARRLIQQLESEADDELDESQQVEDPAVTEEPEAEDAGQAQSEAEAALNPQVTPASFDVRRGMAPALAADDEPDGPLGDGAPVATQAATEHHLEVTRVTVDGEDVEYAAGAAVSIGTFENEYVEPNPAIAVIRATKQLDGADPAADKSFGFKLEPILGAPLPAGDVDVAYNDGAAIEFPAITYTRVGSYLYRLTEVDGGKVVDGIHHDAAVYNVTVRVQNVDGALQATVEYPGDAAPVFSNVTEKPDPGVGQLEISKALASAASAELADATFSFRVTLVGADGTALAGEYAYDGSGTGTLKPDGKGTATVQLKAGEAIVVKGLPAGTVYVVEEVAIPDGYTLHSQTGAAGIIAADETAAAKFVNLPKAAEQGSLVLSKVVTGTTGDDATPFQFKVVFKDSSGTELADSFAYSGSNSGTVKSGDTLRMRNGDALAVTGLPEGTAYTVDEVDIPTGYKLQASSGATGVIAQQAKVSIASFVNAKTTASTQKKEPTTASTRKPTVTKTGVVSTGGKPLTKTGDANPTLALALAGIALAAACVALAAKRRRTQ